jgi:hypothetical protein
MHFAGEAKKLATTISLQYLIVLPLPLEASFPCFPTLLRVVNRAKRLDELGIEPRTSPKPIMFDAKGAIYH